MTDCYHEAAESDSKSKGLFKQSIAHGGGGAFRECPIHFARQTADSLDTKRLCLVSELVMGVIWVENKLNQSERLLTFPSGAR